MFAAIPLSLATLATVTLAAPTNATSHLVERFPVPPYCNNEDVKIMMGVVVGEHTCIHGTGALGTEMKVCGPTVASADISCGAAGENFHATIQRYTPGPNWRASQPVSKSFCVFNGMPTDRSSMPIFYTTYNGNEETQGGNAVNYEGMTFLCEAPTKL